MNKTVFFNHATLDCRRQTVKLFIYRSSLRGSLATWRLHLHISRKNNTVWYREDQPGPHPLEKSAAEKKISAPVTSCPGTADWNGSALWLRTST